MGFNMKMNRRNLRRNFGVLSSVALLLLGGLYGCNKSSQAQEAASPGEAKHVKAFYEEGKYGGWPANWGVWNWGDEILVGFTRADHMERKGHTFDVNTAFAKFARSKDGGLTWSVEDGYEHGITEATFEHNLGDRSVPAKKLDQPIDFTHKDFALTLRARHLLDGPSSFYYSYDRGKTWKGAYKLDVDFPGENISGVVTRTDYIVDGPKQLTAFLTVGFRKGETNWRQVACVRTSDGGLSWQHLAWIGPGEINSIMPSSLRLGPSRLLTAIRRTKPPEMVLFLSEDDGRTWTQLKDPVTVDSNGNPPALLKLQDGRLCIIYGIRQEQTMADGIGMYAAYSGDEGKTWSEPVLLRGHDGAVWDIGYPRAVQRPDGKIVALYYYNNADQGDVYRYIAATIFEPHAKVR